MLTAIVIDDEMLARSELIERLEENGNISVIDQAGNAIDGLKKINRLKPDVVFLDIQMPQVTGIELLAMLDPEQMPNVVFVTAYDQYAIQAFEENAFDYLLKPISDDRLDKTIQKLLKEERKHDLSPLISPQLDHVPCIGLNRIIIISATDIEYAFSDLAGVHIQTKQQQATCQLTLKQLEEKTTMIRCHRQYLINIKAIKEIKLLDNNLAEIITLTEHAVPVSRRYLKSLKEQLGVC
jgi:two-component system LytT family response regulator